MITCVRGFMKTNGGTSAAAAIKRFRHNAEKANIKVVNIAFCTPVGDNVYSIVANIEVDEKP